MIDNCDEQEMESERKRLRLERQKHYDSCGMVDRTLELDGVIQVLKAYDGYDGGINCSVCGKLYKSRVCFIKHIWEHSVYWDLFDGSKNQDRVLSIQAALILYSGCHGDALRELLVRSPSPSEKNVKKFDCTYSLSDLLVTTPATQEKEKQKSERKLSPLKRKHSQSFCEEPRSC